MQSIRLPDPILISTQSALKGLAETLSNQSLVAVDTEANSLYAYRERVCLIQFSIPGTDYLVDPLILDDLSPLGPIFAHPKIEKIFHAAEYDLIILHRDFGYHFECLFDTMASARILGQKSVGLSSLLRDQYGINVNKKYQRADWGRRPLLREMMTYAQLDTHYLIPLRNHFKNELVFQGLWSLAEEDFHRACQVNSNNHERKPVDCWRMNGAQDLSPQQVSVLHELCQYRDEKASTLDRPLFKVIGDKSLVNIAAALPDSMSKLENVHGVSQKQVRWIGRGLLNAVRRGLHKNPPKKTRKKRLSDEHMNRIETLRQWRKITARHLDVESDVVLPKVLLMELAKKNPRNQREMEKILQTVPWRIEQFGDEIFDLLRASKS